MKSAAFLARGMAQPKVVVTGGAGFIGSHLVDDLVPDARVVVVDHLKAGRRENIADAMKAGAKLVKRDLVTGELRSVVRGAEEVYHFAAMPDVNLARGQADAQMKMNVTATYRLLEACRAAKVPRFVFASTSTVYGEAKVVPTPEDYAPLEPISVYGATKLAGESLVSAYAHSYGLQAVVYRMANIIGGRSGHGVVHDLVAKLRKDPRHLEIIGTEPGTSKSYCHITDVVRGIRSGVAHASAPVNVYNLGSDDAINVREIADAICGELGLRGVEYRWTGGSGGGRGWVGDVRSMALSVERLKATGWRPAMTSAQAVRRAARDAWNPSESQGSGRPRR